MTFNLIQSDIDESQKLDSLGVVGRWPRLWETCCPIAIALKRQLGEQISFTGTRIKYKNKIHYADSTAINIAEWADKRQWWKIKPCEFIIDFNPLSI